ncbi:MAG: helix-turn-helix transcriptional regulator [Nitrospirota bacterium]
MDKAKRKRLEARGWRVGPASDFLGLSAEEAALVEMKVSLSQALRARREARGLSQVALAKRLRSSQSRVAKMEAADQTVSIDLLLRGLVVLGATPRDIARVLGRDSGWRPNGQAHRPDECRANARHAFGGSGRAPG